MPSASSLEQKKKAKASREAEEKEKRESYKAAFFEKMKHRKAADLVQGVKVFVTQFMEKPPPDPDRKAEVVRNFLQVLEEKIRNHVLWTGASEAELEEMSETLERFLVAKIYRSIFAPQASDLERDEQLRAKIDLLGSWLEPRHLDISLDTSAKRNAHVLGVAIEQLRKWSVFKAPRDKMVCILNACKAVWKLLGSSKDGKAAGADDFLPHLIYTVIRANPPNLYSTVEYISRYRHPDKMAQEFGYYFTQLASVVPFLEGLTYKSLSISQEEFDANMKGGGGGVKSKTGGPVVSRSSSMLSLWDEPVEKPLQRAASSNSILSLSANQAVQAPAVAVSLPTPSVPTPLVVVSSATSGFDKSLFRFVGRDVNSLTLSEVKDMFAAYEIMAKVLEKSEK